MSVSLFEKGSRDFEKKAQHGRMPCGAFLHSQEPMDGEGTMKTAIAGALVLVVAVTGCQKREKPADDGFGAGATPTDTSARIDTMRTPAIPADSLRMSDTARRPQ